MRFRSGVAVATLAPLATLCAFRADPAEGMPTGFAVAPRIAPTGTTVTVSGGGCSSYVDVVEIAFLFPGHPKSTDTQTVSADPSGAWSAVFSMPSAPAYVIATCDGVESAPVVVAPTDVATGTMTYAALTPTEIEITTSPLVDGSEFTIFGQSGNILGTAVASFGTATVRLPRSLGPAQVLAVGLRQHDPGFPDLQYVPFARMVQLPLPSQTSVVVDPRVSASGSPVTASGNCSGSPRLIVTGRPAGWYDIPPNFVDVSLATDASGDWITSFPMPMIPSTASVFCTQGQVTESAVTLISPSDGLASLVGEIEADGSVVVTIPNVLSPERLAAFTATGRPVPIAILDGSGHVRLPPPGLPERIVIVGIESLGENAQARQNSRVQGWSADVGSLTTGAPTLGLAPARRLSLSLVEPACCGQPALRIPMS